MSVATAWPELQYLSDVNVTLDASADGQALVYDHASGKFIIVFVEVAWCLDYRLADVSGYVALII